MNLDELKVDELKIDELDHVFDGSDRVITTNPNFILREIGDESILVPVGETDAFDNSMLSLNETALYLWKAFMPGATIKEVVEMALNDYTVEDEEEKQMVIWSVVNFAEQGLYYGTLQVKE